MSSEIQAVLFKSRWWKPGKARMWLRKNKLAPIKKVDKTKNTLRYRLIDPSVFNRFFTKKITPTISFVMGVR